MPDDDFWDRHVYKAAGIRLKTLTERGVERFLYVYDFSDDWRQDIFIESVRDGEADVDFPAFVGGEQRCLPEDVGGVPGFMEFLDAAFDPLHVQHNEVVTWYGKPFDPVDIYERWVRLRFAALTARRRGPSRDIEAQRGPIRPDHIHVPLQTATGRQLELCRLSRSERTVAERPSRVADTPAAEHVAG